MRMKITGVLALICVLMLTVTACGTGSTGSDSKDRDNTEETIQVELNQRQKDILADSGLSTEYEELNDSQKSAIQVIEAGLEYMEEKYGGTFCYVGYVPSGVLDQEQLTCYEEGTPTEKVITVLISYKDRVRQFEDNYAEVNAADPYSEALRNHFKGTGLSQFLVITEIKGLKEGYSEYTVINDANAFVRIVFSEESCTREELSSIAVEFSEWMRADNPDGYGEFRFYLFSKEAYRELNIYNFDSVIEEHGSLARITCSLAKDGRTEITEG